MARVDSGLETSVTSEDSDDCPTPRHHSPVVTDPEHFSSLSSKLPPPAAVEPISLSSLTNVTTNNTTAGSNNDSCSQCKFTSFTSRRPNPITCENDLFRLASTCTHHKSLSHQHYNSNTHLHHTAASATLNQNSNSKSNTPALPLHHPLNNMTNRSSSAVVYADHNSRDPEFNMDSIRRPPPKLTGTLVNSCTKAIIRPIAFKPTEIGARHPNYSSDRMKQSLERRNSENFQKENFLRRGNPERMERVELSIVPPNQNNTLNSQRFGGSLCNVLPSKEFSNKNSSTLHISDVGITSLGKMCELSNSHSSYDPYRYEDKGLEKGYGWDSEMKHLQAKLEQALAAHSCQIQQERRNLRQELDSRNSQLEEAEWAICLLKAQLKDCQGDQATRCHEVAQLRTHVKNLAADVSSLRSNLSQSNFNHKAVERENASLKQKLSSQEKIQRNLSEENEILRKKLKELELKHSFDAAMWETERAKWREEQNRVLRYQQLLQKNYVLSCQKVESLLTNSRQPSSNAKFEDHRTGSLQKS